MVRMRLPTSRTCKNDEECLELRRHRERYLRRRSMKCLVTGPRGLGWNPSSLWLIPGEMRRGSQMQNCDRSGNGDEWRRWCGLVRKGVQKSSIEGHTGCRETWRFRNAGRNPRPDFNGDRSNRVLLHTLLLGQANGGFGEPLPVRTSMWRRASILA